MKCGARTRTVAVVCDPQGAEAGTVSAYLARCGLSEADWYLPRDVDEVDAAVQAGVVRTVVFPSIGAELMHAWDETADVGAWLAHGVAVHCAGEPTDGAAWLAAVWTNWRAWRVRRRRRQAVAGVMLGTVALAAACVLMLLK